MDDFYDGDFDDFSDDGDSFEDNSDGEFCDDGLNAEMLDDSEQEDNGIDIGWEEIAIIGGMAEEFSEEEKLRHRIEREMKKDKDQNNF